MPRDYLSSGRVRVLASHAMPGPERVTFTVADADAGRRLDQVLAARVPGLSRRQARGLLDIGGVFVAGRGGEGGGAAGPGGRNDLGGGGRCAGAGNWAAGEGGARRRRAAPSTLRRRV